MISLFGDTIKSGSLYIFESWSDAYINEEFAKGIRSESLKSLKSVIEKSKDELKTSLLSALSDTEKAGRSSAWPMANSDQLKMPSR